MGNEENEQIMRTAVRNERNQMRNEIHKAKNKIKLVMNSEK
jgi:hypothetical protein